MLRLGIIGAESSHTNAFLDLLQQRTDTVVTAICGENEEALKKITDKYHLQCVVDSPADMVGKADAVLVTLRDGAAHLEAVRPLIGHDIAVWVDKPFTVSVSDAKELLRLFKENHTIFSGGTSIKMSAELHLLKQKYQEIGDECLSGYLAYQTYLDGPYSGMHFYSHHLIESMLSVFGCGIRSVLAKRSGDSLAAIASYDGFNVLMNYGVMAPPLYVGVFGQKSSFMTQYRADDGLALQLEEFLTAVKQKKSPYPPEFFLTAVKVCNAVEISMTEEREVYMEEVD